MNPAAGRLPQPNEGFDWVQAAGGPALVCSPLADLAQHIFTTRAWKLGSTDEDGCWDAVAAAMGVAEGRLARLRQVHGAAVVDAAETLDVSREADIAICGDPSIAVAVVAADCAPLLIADRASCGVAAAHAGWRGLAARAPLAAVRALIGAFGSRPADLVAAVGPSIGPCCYEVGGEVRTAFRDAGFSDDTLARWFGAHPRSSERNPSMQRIAMRQPRADRWFFDPSAAACHQLEEAGLPPSQIFTAGLCTASHPSLCSYRRDGLAAGRLAAVIRSRRLDP